MVEFALFAGIRTGEILAPRCILRFALCPEKVLYGVTEPNVATEVAQKSVGASFNAFPFGKLLITKQQPRGGFKLPPERDRQGIVAFYLRREVLVELQV